MSCDMSAPFGNARRLSTVHRVWLQPAQLFHWHLLSEGTCVIWRDVKKRTFPKCQRTFCRVKNRDGLMLVLVWASQMDLGKISVFLLGVLGVSEQAEAMNLSSPDAQKSLLMYLSPLEKQKGKMFPTGGLFRNKELLALFPQAASISRWGLLWLWNELDCQL